MKVEINNNMEMTLAEIDINVSTLGKADLDSEWAEKNTVSPFTRIYFVYGGTGVLTTETERIVLKRGFVYIVPVGLKFDYGEAKNLKKLYCHFNIFKPDMYDLMYACKKIIAMPYETKKIHKIIRMLDDGGFVNSLLFKCELYNIVTKVIEQTNIDWNASVEYSEIVRRTIEYINSNLSSTLVNREIADALYISESKMIKEFKREMGVSVGKYIDDLVFFRAETLLCKNKLTICEISDELGFCDQFQFSKRFKARYGEPPSAYRARVRKSY